MSDEEIKKITERKMKEWLEQENKPDEIKPADVLAVLLGVASGIVIAGVFKRSKLMKRILKLEEKVK